MTVLYLGEAAIIFIAGNIGHAGSMNQSLLSCIFLSLNLIARISILILLSGNPFLINLIITSERHSVYINFTKFSNHCLMSLLNYFTFKTAKDGVELTFPGREQCASIPLHDEHNTGRETQSLEKGQV